MKSLPNLNLITISNTAVSSGLLLEYGCGFTFTVAMSLNDLMNGSLTATGSPFILQVRVTDKLNEIRNLKHILVITIECCILKYKVF